MIGRIAGRLEEVEDGRALVAAGGGLWYEVLAAACDVEKLSRRVGQDVTLHTIHYVEGSPSHGTLTPRLIGFLAEADRDFFRLFTMVKGLGARKALRALVRPMAEVAAAIGAKDARFLASLPEIGARTAERIIAELHGKVEQFGAELSRLPERQMPEAALEAVAVLVQLGERRADAAALVERVLAVSDETPAPEAIIQQAYRLKAGGA
jgi:Holliday junction DNA helicase RuvA